MASTVLSDSISMGIIPLPLLDYQFQQNRLLNTGLPCQRVLTLATRAHGRAIQDSGPASRYAKPALSGRETESGAVTGFATLVRVRFSDAGHDVPVSWRRAACPPFVGRAT